METKELIAILRDESNCNVLDYIDEAANRLEQLEMERNAAIEDIKQAWLCAVCKNRAEGREWLCCRNRKFIEQPSGALTCSNFVWRGVMPDGS